MVAFKYNVVTLEDCFEIYHVKGIACECDGDTKKIVFRKEK
jgi:hypothetical protein